MAPLDLYSYPIDCRVLPLDSGTAGRVREKVEERGGIEDEALKLSVWSPSTSGSDDELDIDILLGLREVRYISTLISLLHF